MRKREVKKQATVRSRERGALHDSLTWGPGFHDALSPKDDVVAQLRWRSRRRSLPTAARSRVACLIIRCAHMLADDAAWASFACVESSCPCRSFKFRRRDRAQVEGGCQGRMIRAGQNAGYKDPRRERPVY